MIIHTMPQGSDEWHQIKWGKIGGSSSKGLLKPTDDLYLEILGEHLEEYEEEDSFSSFASDYGHLYEPIARDYLIEKTGIIFRQIGFIESEKNNLLGISPDGLDDTHTIACEIKCLQRKAHTKMLHYNDIPLEYIPQLVHYFHVIETLESLHFLGYRHQSNHFNKILNRDSIVNIGTEAKPVMKTINEAVLIAKENAEKLKDRLEKRLSELTF